MAKGFLSDSSAFHDRRPFEVQPDAPTEYEAAHVVVWPDHVYEGAAYLDTQYYCPQLFDVVETQAPPMWNFMETVNSYEFGRTSQVHDGKLELKEAGSCDIVVQTRKNAGIALPVRGCVPN
ncbi:hypothetical protein PIB30_028618 [Stylosanthes scabra]|uniref:Uncharacterized protein n=1 Tax=Stylosanthes scabra TaxID=79078 RepID=A0ABU6YCV6_9FABA|nr:hypothetical protein [Stylosanthes scabra]